MLLVAGSVPNLTIEQDVTMANDFRGTGRIEADSPHWLTVTGSLSPFDTGLTDREPVVGPQGSALFRIDRLRFGTDTVGATYNWQYNGATNDWTQTADLEFGTAAPTLNIEWLGEEEASHEDMSGTHVLFTYTGANPVLPETWHVNAPPKMRGAVRLEVNEKSVLLDISKKPPAGTVILFM